MAVSSQPDMAEIASVFGGSVPHSLSEYYAAASGIPVSGEISLSQFIGKSGVTQKTLTVTEGNTEYLDGYVNSLGAISTGSISSTSLNGKTVRQVSTSIGSFVIGFTGQFTVPPFERVWIEGGTWFSASNFRQTVNVDSNISQFNLITTEGSLGRAHYNAIVARWNGSGTSRIIAEY